eukprot:TRINITY_DN23183_c0_g1_i1.p1 TRINITY_DN23183_c0_g1~~TRINITY_DN23183_c0_g1_i1.p1  ORF type:complete len:352 (-),score=93.26 TRINITY_DN23183_c0_g1_i1:42-1097(-)
MGSSLAVLPYKCCSEEQQASVEVVAHSATAPDGEVVPKGLTKDAEPTSQVSVSTSAGSEDSSEGLPPSAEHTPLWMQDAEELKQRWREEAEAEQVRQHEREEQAAAAIAQVEADAKEARKDSKKKKAPSRKTQGAKKSEGKPAGGTAEDDAISSRQLHVSESTESSTGLPSRPSSRNSSKDSSGRRFSALIISEALLPPDVAVESGGSVADSLPDDVNKWTQEQRTSICKEALEETQGQSSCLYIMDKGLLTVKAHFAKPKYEEFAHQCYDFKFASGVGLPGRTFKSKRPGLLPDVRETDIVNVPRKDFALKVGIVCLSEKPLGSNAVLEVASKQRWDKLPEYMKQFKRVT